MLFLHSFSHKLCLILFGHTAIMFQYRWILWSTRGDIVMVHIVPISPPLFFRPPKFIVWVVFWYFDFCHLRVKNKGAVSHRYFRNHVKTYGQVLFSAIFPKSILYIGRSCRTDPAPFSGFRQIPASKSIVPLQGFEPCFVLRLFNQICTPYTNRRVPSAA